MFDFAKGIGMFIVVFGHSFGYLEYGESGIARDNLSTIWQSLSDGLMILFFIISGYRHKRKENRSCIKSQWNTLVIPYYKVAVICCILEIPISLLFKKNIGEEFRSRVLGFLLCNFSGTTLGEFYVKGIYPIWFILVLAIATIVLNIILQLKRKHRILISIFMFFLYAIYRIHTDSSWGIGEVLIATVAMYIGYELKQIKWLNSQQRNKAFSIVAMGILLAASSIPTDNYYLKMVLFTLGRIVAGILLLWAIQLLNRYENKLTDSFRFIGRYTYWIMCIHTVECMCIPFEMIMATFPTQRILVVASIFVIMDLIIIVGCFVMNMMTKRKNRKYVYSRKRG